MTFLVHGLVVVIACIFWLIFPRGFAAVAVGFYMYATKQLPETVPMNSLALGIACVGFMVDWWCLNHK